MEPITWVFGGIAVAAISGAIGRGFNNKNNVKETICKERMGGLTLLLTEKIDNLAKDIKDIKKAVNKTVQ